MNSEYLGNRKNISWQRWLPTPGNVIFTLITVVGVLWAQSVGALGLMVTQPPIQIPYQGRLADRNGTSLGGDYKMTFKLYNALGAPTPLWTEVYQDANKIKVSNGLFNAMLGSLSSIAQNVISDNPELYLGVTINDDPEMTPRVKLGSVPFATQAWTVPDGLITSVKLAPNAVKSDHITDGTIGNADLAPNAVTGDRILDGSVGTNDLANASVTAIKIAPDVKLSLPSGSVIMWSGAINTIPIDWQLCDGTNGMPDLRDKFLVGAGSTYAVGATGGAAQVTLTEAQMPSHSHSLSIDAAGQHSHGTRLEDDNGFEDGSNQGGVDNTSGAGNIRTTDDGNHTHTGIASATGGGQPFENRPPYFALALICKK